MKDLRCAWQYTGLSYTKFYAIDDMSLKSIFYERRESRESVKQNLEPMMSISWYLLHLHLWDAQYTTVQTLCTTAEAQWIPLLENVADLAPNGLCLAPCGEMKSTFAVELPFPDWFHWKPQWIAIGLDVVLSVFLHTHSHPQAWVSCMLLGIIPHFTLLSFVCNA